LRLSTLGRPGEAGQSVAALPPPGLGAPGRRRRPGEFIDL